MAPNTTVDALYTALVAADDTDLDPRAQRRILSFALDNANPALAAALVARSDVCDEVLDTAKGHQCAPLAAAWYANTRTTHDEVLAQVRVESRPSVLVALARREDTPGDLLCELAASTTSVKVATALLSSRKLTLDLAHRCATLVLATSPPPAGKVANAVSAAATADPLLTTKLVDDAVSLRHAAKILDAARIWDSVSLVTAVRRVTHDSLGNLDHRDDRNDVAELRAAVQIVQRMVRYDLSHAVTEELRELIEWLPSAPAVLTLHLSSIHPSFVELRESLAEISDPCAEELEGADPAAPADIVLARLSAAIAAIDAFKRAQTLTRFPRSRSLER